MNSASTPARSLIDSDAATEVAATEAPTRSRRAPVKAVARKAPRASKKASGSAVAATPADVTTVARKTPRKKVGRRHANRRTEILRTAAQLFAVNGYEATSLDMIADQLGMHKATLYHYIKSKEEVLYQCLISSFEDLDEVIVEVKDTNVPVRQRLRHFCINLAHAQNNDFGRCLVLVGSRPLEAGTDRGIRDFQIKLDNTVRGLIAEGIETGDFRPCEPSMVSAMLFGTLNWVPRWYKPGGRLGLEEIVDSFLEMLVLGIAPRQDC